MFSGSSPPRRDPLRLVATVLLALTLFSFGWIVPGIREGYGFGMPLILPYMLVSWLIVIGVVACVPASDD